MSPLLPHNLQIILIKPLWSVFGELTGGRVSRQAFEIGTVVYSQFSEFKARVKYNNWASIFRDFDCDCVIWECKNERRCCRLGFEWSRWRIKSLAVIKSLNKLHATNNKCCSQDWPLRLSRNNMQTSSRLVARELEFDKRSSGRVGDRFFSIV